MHWNKIKVKIILAGGTERISVQLRTQGFKYDKIIIKELDDLYDCLKQLYQKDIIHTQAWTRGKNIIIKRVKIHLQHVSKRLEA